jgi:glycosyltransferase involved in cell wall biosynthesis
MLAHDSEATIVTTLESLLEQSLVQSVHGEFQVEVIIVANGCSDRTAEMARSVLRQSKSRLPDHVSVRVQELDVAGKCNAWNRFVHEFSDQTADYLLLMDSDITFLNCDTLVNLIRSLQQDSNAAVSVDTPIKDIELQPGRRWIERLSARLSESSRRQWRSSICGQLYCARGEMLRQIWLPNGLPVEDGFLRAMVLTNGFQSGEDFHRIIRAENASHRFEAHVQARKLLRHEEWLIASSTINSFLYDFLWKQCRERRHAGQLVRELNGSDPEWFAKLVAERISNRSWWIVPWPFVFRRFQHLRRTSLFVAARSFPIACVAFVIDCVLCTRVNRHLKLNKGISYWRSADSL